MWVSDNNFLCKCGSLLQNTCNSAIKTHKKTNKHKNLMCKDINSLQYKLERKPKKQQTLKIIRQKYIMIWD